MKIINKFSIQGLDIKVSKNFFKLLRALFKLVSSINKIKTKQDTNQAKTKAVISVKKVLNSFHKGLNLLLICSTLGLKVIRNDFVLSLINVFTCIFSIFKILNKRKKMHSILINRTMSVLNVIPIHLIRRMEA